MSPEPDYDTALRIAEQAAEWLERLKTALAIIGLCTLVWHIVRIVGGTRAPAAT